MSIGQWQWTEKAGNETIRTDGPLNEITGAVACTIRQRSEVAPPGPDDADYETSGPWIPTRFNRGELQWEIAERGCGVCGSG